MTGTHGAEYPRSVTLLALFYGRSICFLLRMAIPPLIPFFVEQFGWNSLQVGLLASAYLWSYAATQILWGLVVDKWGGKKALLAGWLIMASASFAFALGSSLEQLALSRLLFGCGAASVLVASVVIISEAYEVRGRGRAIGVIGSSSSIGILFAGIAIPWLLSTNIRLYSLEAWRSVYVLVALPAILAIFSLMVIPDKSKNSSKAPFTRKSDSPVGLSKRAVFGDARLYLMGLASAGYIVGFTVISTWIYVYLYQEYGLPATSAGILASFAIFVPGIPGSVFSGWLSDRLRTRTNVSIIGAVASAGLMAVLVFDLPLTFLTLSLILYGIFAVFHTPILSLPAETWSPEVSGTALGLVVELSQVGAAITPVVSGYLLAETGSYNVIWILGAAAYLLAAAALVPLRRPHRQGPL